MSEITIVYLIVSLFGVYSSIRSGIRFWGAKDIKEKRQACFSLISDFIFIAICGATIYVCTFGNMPWWLITGLSCILFALNEFLHWKIIRRF